MLCIRLRGIIHFFRVLGSDREKFSFPKSCGRAGTLPTLCVVFPFLLLSAGRGRKS